MGFGLVEVEGLLVATSFDSAAAPWTAFVEEETIGVKLGYKDARS